MPSATKVPDGGDAWRGASLAVEETNAAGGIDGRPLHLVTRWADDPWRGGASHASRLVYDDAVLAIIGSLDGASTHLAEQIVVKARLPLVSPLSTDPSVNLAGVSWMLSCLPGDDVIAPLLVDAATAAAGGAPLALAMATDHDSRIAAGELRKVCSHRAIPLTRIAEWTPESSVDEIVPSILRVRPGAVLVSAPAPAAARIIVALRAGGYEGTIVGTTPLGRHAFAKAAGPAAEGVIVPILHEPGPAWDEFASRWQARFGSRPDETAAQSYDAVRVVAAALATSGPNRARLLDALRNRPPWTGIMGVHDWDGLGRNRRLPSLGRWRAGKVVPFDSNVP